MEGGEEQVALSLNCDIKHLVFVVSLFNCQGKRRKKRENLANAI
jgi:hypothetical protein